MLFLAVACTAGDAPLLDVLPTGSTPTGSPDSAPPSDTAGFEPSVPDPAPEPLEITFLGVGGFLIRSGGHAVLTPPMYTNPDLLETTLGTIHSDPELVARLSAGVDLGDVRAVLVGHGHYDHLLDAPTLWPRTAQAPIYGNATVRHLLAAFAPDRAPYCTEPRTTDVVIPRDRVVQLDDPQGELGRDLVDWRMCPDDAPAGAGEGAWIQVDGAPIRFRPLCSMHPDQFGPIHFAPGSLHADVCEPPEHADDWLEGQALAFLIDFLDAEGRPVHRVYYQDAPSEAPVGLFHPELLEERGVDVALLNVGSYDQVPDQPGATVRLMQPRYVVGGHWEDFFRTQDRPLIPIFAHDVDAWAADAVGALSDTSEAPVEVDGTPVAERVWVPDPGTTFRFGLP